MKQEGEMRKLLIIPVLIISFLHGAEAQGADWKYYGGVDLPKGEIMKAYYDAEKIERLSDGHVRVWTKSIGLSEVERIMDLEEVTKRAAGKIKAGYVPPYILSSSRHEPGYDVNTRIIFWEEAANYDVIKSKLKVFYELNCKAKEIQALSSISYKDDGKTEARSDAEKWISISAGSNSETLHKILCR
jgi:hypothetical protein